MSKTVLALDFETFSDTDLRQHGLDRYTADPGARVLMCAYQINGVSRPLWEPRKDPIPAELRDALADPHVEKWAFNAQFERVWTRRVLKIKTPYKGWRCTMVLAYMQSFTGGLGDIGEQMGLPSDKLKNKEGSRLIRMFCMPQKVSKSQPHRIRDWRTDPADWQKFGVYCEQDVVAEEAIRSKLLHFHVPEEEWLLYEIDQEINDRGMPVDVRFVDQAIAMSTKRKRELLTQLNEITGLANSGSTAQFLPWLVERGYPFKDLQKDSVKKALRAVKDGTAQVTEEAVKALTVRQWAARMSVKKYDALKAAFGPGDRMRFLFQFGGASRTLRWAGRRVQAQNLPGTPASIEPDDRGDEKLVATTEMIREGQYDDLAFMFDEPMEALVGCVRSAFRAREGYHLVAADLSSIESVVLGYLSRCERLLNVFREGRDSYKDFATEVYRIPYSEVTKAQRKFSKPGVLGCFGEDTPVLTERGWIRIVDVQADDRVFDGFEFVRHGGVVDQGIKDVVDLYGVLATPDHLMLCAGIWMPAADMTDPKIVAQVRTFDLLNCGPRSRFLVRTSVGPLVAHNCGYRLGGGEIRDGKRTGLWGYAENMGVDMTREEAHRVVQVFRATYPEIVQFWYDTENAVMRAMRGEPNVRVGGLTFNRERPYLTMALPTGRKLHYFQPRMEQRVMHTGRMRKVWEGGRCVGEEEETYVRTVFTYMGQNQKTGEWLRLENHGGRWAEQSTQATAREVLATGIRRAHEAGFRIVGHVHDEIISEERIGDNEHTLARLIEIMRSPLDCMPGLPLGAAGWVGGFYRK